MGGCPLYFLPGQAPTWTTRRGFPEPGKELAEALQGDIQRCGEDQPRWDPLWEKAVATEQLVSPERRPFYRAHVLAMIAIDRESNRTLQSLAGVYCGFVRQIPKSSFLCSLRRSVCITHGG